MSLSLLKIILQILVPQTTLSIPSWTPVFRIRIGFNLDPDPDPEGAKSMQIYADLYPKAGQATTVPVYEVRLKVESLHFCLGNKFQKEHLPFLSSLIWVRVQENKTNAGPDSDPKH